MQKKAFKTFTALPEDLSVLDRNTRTYLIRMAMSCVHTQIQNVALPEAELKVASVVCTRTSSAYERANSRLPPAFDNNSRHIGGA